MPARHSWSSPSSAPPPPSSPPFSFPAHEYEHNSDRASPTWTAPSPTRTLVFSSPELPPLPSLSAPGNPSRTPSTAAPNDRTDTSYYTASWGSPYRNPPPPPDSQAQRLVETHPSSDDLEDGSSALHFSLGHLLPSRLELEEESPNRFNLDHLIPRLDQNASPVQFTLEHLIRSRLPHLEASTRAAAAVAAAVADPTTPPGNLTHSSDTHPTSDEWVHRFLETRWNRQANDWNTSSDTEGSLGELQPSFQPPPKRGHKDRNQNKTLNQQDFWRHFSKDEKTAIGKMMASKYADPDITPAQTPSLINTSRVPPTANGHATRLETSPTPLPAKTHLDVSHAVAHTTAEKAPIRSNVTPLCQPLPETSGQTLLAPPDVLRPQTPRVRKKVVVKGKACIISIPRDIPRGSLGYPPKPMSNEAVHAKLQRLESEGYDVRGFDMGIIQPHNRAIWPTENDVRLERENLAFHYPVRVAKLSEWKDYENSLLEAKLAALGVSVGGEADVPLPMSRQTSSQHPGLPFSPPIPTSSAGSHHRVGRKGSVVSTHFPLGTSPGHMSRQSIASPAAFTNPRASMHMHRHSTFASPASFTQHGISPSGNWSPGGYFGAQEGRSSSPALNRANLSGLRSPHSPYGISPHQQYPLTPTANDELLLQMHLQQQQIQAQMLQQQQQPLQQQQQQQLLGTRPSSTLAATVLAEVPEDEDEENEPPARMNANKPAPEIAIPTPRGHRHNISENLEREAANEEYHLEEAIDKQFAEGGDFSTELESQPQFSLPGPIANAPWEETRTILHQPQPHSRAHSLAKPHQPSSLSFAVHPQNVRTDSDGARSNLSENTNPSLEEGEMGSKVPGLAHHSKGMSQLSSSWKDNKFAVNPSRSTMHSTHASRSSISKLNVEAKEFKFNPAASFNPGSVSSEFSFPPANGTVADSLKSGDGIYGTDEPLRLNASTLAFKPTAPVFTPTAPAFHAATSSVPTSGFNFSNPPFFKTDAPVFDSNVATLEALKTDIGPTSFSSEIFGQVHISASDIIKPATRSRAVPIVRPDTASDKTTEDEFSGEEKEDIDGRPIQSDGREKRARLDRIDGDEVPKFALQPVLPSQPLSETNPRAANDILRVEPRYTSENKENESPDLTQAHAKIYSSKTPHAPVLAATATTPTTLSIDLTTAGDAEPSPSTSDVPTPTAENPEPIVKKLGHKSTLSANAKPFEFRPSFDRGGYDFEFHVKKPSRAEDTDKPRISPPGSSRSQATTFRPSDDGSYKTALESGRHAPYPESESVDLDGLGDPSFNDIDAVMKHMDDEGSDFGVERDETSWHQSSPHREPHEFDRRDLQPSFQIRSDAPSPSPRRVAVPRHRSGSVASAQGKFDDERAVIGYSSPVYRLNHADEVPVSDWDEGLLPQGDDRIQTRSRFFDIHVDHIMGRLLQSRLGPLEQNLHDIQEALAALSQRPGRSRRSMSNSEHLDSDADDEDEDVGSEAQHPNRPPRKDKRLEKIRSVVKEVFDFQQSQMPAVSLPSPDPMLPDKIRDIVTDVFVSHQRPTTTIADQVGAEQIRAMVYDAIASAPASDPQPTDSDRSHDIRSIIMEAFATYAPQPIPPPVPEQIWPEDLKAIVLEAIADHANQQLQPDHVRELIDHALQRQSLEIANRAESEAIIDRDARIADLEAQLKNCSFRLDVETKARTAAEARESDTARLLKVTEEELTLLQQTAREDGDRIRALTEERDVSHHSLEAHQATGNDVTNQLSRLDSENADLKHRISGLESSEHDLKQRLLSINAENTALASTLEEHRLSANKWRDDVQVAHMESEKLRQSVEQARAQAEEASRIRESMRSKLDKLQQDMVAASQQVAAERAQWQKSQEVADSRYEVLSARIEAEGRTRERLERELERLETQEREGMKLRIHLEQTQKHNGRLEDMVDQLRKESLAHQRNAERHERDVREARDAAHVEIRRTRVLMDADIDAANNQVNIVRHELESEIGRIRAELDQVRLDADTAKERHELDLEAASDSRKQAVHEVLEHNRLHQQEQQRSFERQLEQAKQEHARALAIVCEDKDRAQAFHDDKLALADSRLDHFKDKIVLLEEKLEIAKQAASAAIAAASKSGPSMSSSAPSGTEKISIQALRESISVLQEQLQERESRIESLERQIEDIDVDSPAKLKERDTEINWLRELLGVRVDDLNDLINSLAQPSFDRERVRDAAIRIRTNLQIEQSEKERLISGGQQSFPTLSTLSNFASPKAVQLAAAFGNWRNKGRGEAASALSANPVTASQNHPLARAAPPSGQSFLSGLLTPPKSGIRSIPVSTVSSTQRPQLNRSDSSSSSNSTVAGFPSLKKQIQFAAPRTPPLMRKANYDQDAENEPFSESGFYDDDSTIGGEGLAPLAINFGQELPR